MSKLKYNFWLNGLEGGLQAIIISIGMNRWGLDQSAHYGIFFILVLITSVIEVSSENHFGQYWLIGLYNTFKEIFKS